MHSIFAMHRCPVYLTVPVNIEHISIASICGLVLALSVSNPEVVGLGPLYRLPQDFDHSATCSEIQNLMIHNPEICHKFLSLVTNLRVEWCTSQKQCLVSNLWQKFPPPDAVKRLRHRVHSVSMLLGCVHACTIDSSICSFTCPFFAENC